MKTPSQVLSSDNSDAIAEVSCIIDRICEELRTSFETAIENACKKVDRNIHVSISVYDYEFSLYPRFFEEIEERFRNSIGAWSKYIFFSVNNLCKSKNEIYIRTSYSFKDNVYEVNRLYSGEF